MNQQAVINTTRNWVQKLVIDLNLCPFARRELVNDRIRFAVSDAADTDTLLADLHRELQRLLNEPAIETTLLIHPGVLTDFLDYNEFLADADALLGYLDLEGIVQIASFHPDYQFAGTEAGDVENATNRSPFPMLHLLREESLEQAIARYPDTDTIPQQNIETVTRLGPEAMAALLRECRQDGQQED